MTTAYDIRYLLRQEIDILKWDRAIEASPNGLIYGRSYYLDHMTGGQWDALVLNDYEAIMPLTWRKKGGIRYLYQPPYTQQLGIFFAAADATSPGSAPPPAGTFPGSAPPPAGTFPGSASPQPSVVPLPSTLSAALIEKFLTEAGRHFRFAEIFLNHYNPHPLLTAHANFILDLAAPYNELASQYKKGLVASLSIAERSSLQIVTDPDLSVALKINKEMVKDKTPHVGEESYRQFRNLCFFLRGRGQLLLRAVTKSREDATTPTGDPLAIVLFLRDRNRIYLLQATTPAEGRDIGANHFLLDHVIREFAGQSMILDFEGSDLPGVAHFYKSFGAQDQPYYFYRHNRLYWPWRLFK